MLFGEIDRQVFVQHLHETVAEASGCTCSLNNNAHICSFRFISISLSYSEPKICSSAELLLLLPISFWNITVFKSHNLDSQKTDFPPEDRNKKKKNTKPLSSGQELPVCVSV